MSTTAWTTLSIVSILGWLILVVPGLAGRGLTVPKTIGLADVGGYIRRCLSLVHVSGGLILG